MSHDRGHELLCKQASSLLASVNHYEGKFVCTVVLETILDMLSAHYVAQSSRQQQQMQLAANFYAYKDGKVFAALPVQYEKTLMNLWLRHIEAQQVQVDGQSYMLRLHPDQICDGKPLPLLVGSDKGSPTMFPIRQRMAHRVHSHLLQNDPGFTGYIFDAACVDKWMNNANFVRATTVAPHVHVWPNHAGFCSLADMWLGQKKHSKQAANVLVADAVNIGKFVSCMHNNPGARCHFTLSGQSTLYAYLFLTANDGLQSELYRLAIGTYSGLRSMA